MYLCARGMGGCLISRGMGVYLILRVCYLILELFFYFSFYYIYFVGTYWLFVAIVFVAFVFLYITLPETKGLKLEEVQRLFERGSCMCGRTYDDDIRKDEELVVSAVGDTTKL